MSEGPGAPRAEGRSLSDDRAAQDGRAFEEELAAVQEAQAAGDAAKARALMEKALRRAPGDQRARNLLGLTLFKLGDLDRAETIYRGLIEDHPADPTLRVNLGLVFLKRGASIDAVRSFTTALDLQPEHGKAQNYLGLAYAQKGDHAQARDWFVRSGNAAMAERMAALLAVAAQKAAERAAEKAAERAAEKAAENPGVTSEFARVRPAEVTAPQPPKDSTVRPVEIGRLPLLAISSNPSLPKVPVRSLPSWPAQPSGSTLEGAAAAMQSMQEMPASGGPGDTDPSMPPTMLDAAPAEPAAAVSRPDAAELASPAAAAPALETPAASTSEPPSEPAVESPAARALESPVAPALEPLAAPARVVLAAPRAVEPTPLSSYTRQRRLEVPASESSFSIGSAELVIQVRGEMLTRLDGLVASWGSATVRPELKRFRGKATDKTFGDGARRMFRVLGEGRYVIAREGRAFTPLELGDEPAYFREEVLFAFEESLVFENGRVPSKLGGDLHLVHLRGRGRLLLVSAGVPRSVEVRKGEPLRIPMSQLVGWHGPLIQPRVVSIVEDAPEFGIALELAGEGRALVDSSNEA